MATFIRPILLLAVLVATLACVASASAASFGQTNPTAIAVPGSGTSGPGSPYPSAINVDSVVGPVTDVNVTLHGVSHAQPANMRVVLVSPAGRAVTLMGANCGSTDVDNFTWIFDQQAAQPMPGQADCPGFVYQPAPATSNINLPAPAPPSPYGRSLDLFNGENPNGTWSLYVEDTTAIDAGEIKRGWSLSLTTDGADAVVPGTGEAGPAGDYPLTRTFDQTDRVIKDLDVRLNGVWHQRPDDLDILLVGPRGQSTVLMSDACGSKAAIGADWTWDDEAGAEMPISGGCRDGSHQPTDYFSGEGFPSPAPLPPYGVDLADFDGTDPSGQWRMFVLDDESGGWGFFTSRFAIEAETRPKAQLSFDRDEISVAEGETRTVKLTRSADGRLGSVLVTVRGATGSAREGDFTPVERQVRFAPLQAEAEISLDAFADGETEGDEYYSVAVVDVHGDAAVARPDRLQVRIPGSSSAACAGVGATIIGTDSPEVIRGTSGDDVIAGLGGDDRIRSGGGNDTVCAGGGNDRLAGGPGKDRLLGGGGNDRVSGGPGRDSCPGGPGRNKIRCERG